MLTTFPIFTRPFSHQPNDNPPSSQPFTFFVLPETSTISEPVIPILVAVILPVEISKDYQLSDFFVVSEGLFVPTFPLLEEPFFDSETNSFVWLFSGLFDVSEISQSFLSSSFTLSAHAFFEPLEPSLPSLSAFDFLSLTFSLPQEEREGSEEGEEKTASETGKKSSGDSQTVSGKEEEKGETGMVARSEKVSKSKVQSAKEAILRDPERARKAFEQEIAAKAISNAKKNPKSKAKVTG